ncbi:hypothetical protein K2173_006280 [Erythroxylum novogranatense]|uniref:Remorin C-terminal domain-containing protein n=1 Tax=Erythroxylum novogranatense TaxID=1862640 RepID=A0AAV8TEA5_9ROSI|nr:hypothetical protein K2173_006280 [Erythroxylum novogranatense]
MKQHLVSSQSLGTFPSPGLANYQDKGWSSERVPRPSGAERRHMNALRPFYSGKAFPSKWDDAERWICSPVSGCDVAKNTKSRPQRRPKSKSGPIVPPGIGHYSNYSPSLQVPDGGSVKSLVTTSPFSTGVLMPKGVAIHYEGVGNSRPATVVSLPGWSSDVVSECSLPSSQDERFDAENAVTHDVSRRDMATQMSPEGSNHSFARRSYPPSIPPEVESEKEHAAKVEVREVRIDKRSTMIRWSKSKRHGSCVSWKGSGGVKDYNQNRGEAWKSSWDISDAASDFSKLKREEAKITAWENLQKAKAEAAVRKLEMKLEKKRSSSMDKILNKLRSAEIKADEMRSSVLIPRDHEIPKLSNKFPFLHKLGRFRSLSSCYFCHAL